MWLMLLRFPTLTKLITAIVHTFNVVSLLVCPPIFLGGGLPKRASNQGVRARNRRELGEMRSAEFFFLISIATAYGGMSQSGLC